MGIARSWPEPVIEYQVRRLTQCAQMQAMHLGYRMGVDPESTPPCSPLRMREQDLYLETGPFRILYQPLERVIHLSLYHLLNYFLMNTFTSVLVFW